MLWATRVPSRNTSLAWANMRPVAACKEQCSLKPLAMSSLRQKMGMGFKKLALYYPQEGCQADTIWVCNVPCLQQLLHVFPPSLPTITTVRAWCIGTPIQWAAATPILVEGARDCVDACQHYLVLETLPLQICLQGGVRHRPTIVTCATI